MKKITVEEEYAKHKEIRPEDVKSLMEWVEKQPHLPKITELETISFLTCYGGSIEQAKGLIDIYYTSRTHCPEFFEDRNPKVLGKDIDIALHYPLESANAFYTTCLDSNPSNYNMNEQIKLLWMVFDLWLIQNGSIDGFNFIIDMKCVQFGHLARFNLLSAKKAVYVLQEALPAKITKIHVVNSMPIADKLLSLLKPFIKAELLDKIIFHKPESETLFKYISKDNLPKNLGGTGPTSKEMHDSMKRMLNENLEFFKNEEISKRVDETKRPGRPKNSSDLFGTEGSFKKLDID